MSIAVHKKFEYCIMIYIHNYMMYTYIQTGNKLNFSAKVLQSKVRRAVFVEFRGHHGDVGIAAQTFLCTFMGGEESDKDDVALTHSMLLQHSNGCDHCGTTL